MIAFKAEIFLHIFMYIDYVRVILIATDGYTASTTYKYTAMDSVANSCWHTSICKLISLLRS